VGWWFEYERERPRTPVQRQDAGQDEELAAHRQSVGIWTAPAVAACPPLSDISQLAEQVKAAVVKRKNARGGRGAAEHLIAALPCLSSRP
jgi:hypothetical protein